MGVEQFPPAEALAVERLDLPPVRVAVLAVVVVIDGHVEADLAVSGRLDGDVGDVRLTEVQGLARSLVGR